MRRRGRVARLVGGDPAHHGGHLRLRARSAWYAPPARHRPRAHSLRPRSRARWLRATEPARLHASRSGLAAEAPGERADQLRVPSLIVRKATGRPISPAGAACAVESSANSSKADTDAASRWAAPRSSRVARRRSPMRATASRRPARPTQTPSLGSKPRPRCVVEGAVVRSPTAGSAVSRELEQNP